MSSAMRPDFFRNKGTFALFSESKNYAFEKKIPFHDFDDDELSSFDAASFSPPFITKPAPPSTKAPIVKA